MNLDIKIIAIGKIKFDYIKEGIKDYAKRLKRFCRLEILELKERSVEKMEKEKIKNLEGDEILKKVNKGYIVVLDKKGKQLASEEFSEVFKEIRDFKGGKIIFIIGGAFGLPDKVLKKADLVLSFSKMTFPHQLFRLILLEQIYRAFKILEGSDYHK